MFHVPQTNQIYIIEIILSLTTQNISRTAIVFVSHEKTSDESVYFTDVYVHVIQMFMFMLSRCICSCYPDVYVYGIQMFMIMLSRCLCLCYPDVYVYLIQCITFL